MRFPAYAALVAALVAGSAAPAADRSDLRACFPDIRKLCRSHVGDRPAMRTCMMENHDQLSSGCKDALRSMAGAQDPAVPSLPAKTIAYGDDAKQTIEFYAATARERAPLVVFIHGGGWSRGDAATSVAAKPLHFTQAGYAFASIGYRLVPGATVEQQAADVAAAVARLRADAPKLGVDPDRIALMGHSAGAHLAALVGTDPAYLRDAGVPMAAVKAVILLDGAGYDVPRQMATGEAVVQELYKTAFGTDPARQTRLSPVSHAAAPNAASFQIVFDAGRAASRTQSTALAEALRKAGTPAALVPVADTNHMKLNRGLGADGDAATATVDAFLSQAL